ISSLKSSGRALLKNVDGGQHLALEKLQKSAAAGRDIADLIGNAVLGDGGQRVSASGDRKRVGLGDCAGDGLGASGKGVELKHADWAVPDDGSCLAQLVSQHGRRVGADVQDQVVVVDFACRLDSGGGVDR